MWYRRPGGIVRLGFNFTWIRGPEVIIAWLWRGILHHEVWRIRLYPSPRAMRVHYIAP